MQAGRLSAPAFKNSGTPEDTAKNSYPGNVDQNIIWSQLFLDFLEGRRQLRAVGHIGFHGNRRDVQRLKFAY